MAQKKRATVSHKKVVQLEERNAELEKQLLRALADYANLEERVKREKKDVILYANEVLLTKLLPLLDDIERAATHSRDQGVQLVSQRFQEVLKQAGVTPIECVGKKFDPEIAECVEVVEGEEEKIIEMTQKGYLLRDKILRPAKVKVGGGKK